MSIRDDLNTLPIDYLLSEYRIKRIIGSGGFGITYYAEDINLNKPVAIKEYLPNEFAVRTDKTTVKPKSSADRDDYQWGLERFLDEARTLARFKHPHLNEVYRFFKDNGTAYLVLEYIDGETLADLLKRERKVNADCLYRLLRELLSGLAIIHEAGFIHRDIKPPNIMLRKDGSAVLLDFGAARQAAGRRSRKLTLLFTRGYAPIEQYEQHADAVGPWTDLYALGMVAYRCISGLRGNQLLDAIARDRLQRKGEEANDMPSAVKVGNDQYDIALLQAIDWAIKVNEQERPQSAAEMISTFAVFRQGEQGQPQHSVEASNGQIPLHLAAQENAIKTATLLIANGEDMDAQDSAGCTPLHLAAQENAINTAALLIERGADLSARNNDGDTPLDVAIASKSDAVVQALYAAAENVTRRV